MLLSLRSIECNAINKLLPDRCTHAINEPKLCCVKYSSSQGTHTGASFSSCGKIASGRACARAHTHLRTLNLIVRTIAIGPADSSLSISQNSDHPSWKKQLVFFIENKNRYGTLAQASATTTTTTAAMTITMDIKHNTIIQYTRRLSAKKMRKRERKSFMHATLRIEKFLSSEAFELRIFDAAYSLGGGRGAFIWCIYLFLSFLFW